MASRKHSWAVYVKSAGEINIGALYVPPRLTDFVKQIYAELGAEAEINNSGEPAGDTGIVECEQDEYHKTLYAYIKVSGRDLTEEMAAVESGYTDSLQTSVVFLNIQDPAAVYGFEALKEAGYKFAGLKPLCGEHEYIIMSKTNDVVIDASEFQMTDALRRLFVKVGEAE